MARPVILIVDLDDWLRNCVNRCAGMQHVEVVDAANETAVTTSLRDLAADDLLVIDTRDCSESHWFDAMLKAKQLNLSAAVITIPTESSEARAIAALKVGVDDYFRQPFEPEDLRASIERLRAAGSSRSLQERCECRTDGFDRMIGSSQAIRNLKARIALIAGCDSTALALGETGTGKELVAELIHLNSDRRAHRLVSLNCAAIPDSLLESELFGHERGAFTGAAAARKGAFEQANGGTLFLDEIGDMSLHGQTRLLRVIETRSVQRLGGNRDRPADCRLIAATNHDLEALIEAGRFREDVFYRLNVVRLELPPLRDRKEDLPELCEHFLRQLESRFGKRVSGFSQEAFETLLHHDWPGNIRELGNVLEGIIVTLRDECIDCKDLPSHLLRRMSSGLFESATEQERLLAALHATNWNKSRAADQLNWSRMTLYRKIQKYGIAKSRHAMQEPVASRSLRPPVTQL